MRPGHAVLTAIRFADGRCVTCSGSEAELRQLAETAAESYRAPRAVPALPPAQEPPRPEPVAAVTVRRPTPCCPQCHPGAVGPASEVLLAFLSEEEHESWARERSIVVEGGLSGHRYLLAHRHTARAQRVGRICYDLDARAVVHFHDMTVPPEEEVLAAKLILEHREPWLRNEATLFCSDALKFKNPFGDGGDGMWDSSLTSNLGSAVLKCKVPDWA